MTKLNVSNDLKLPLDVITMATAILGLRGSGKTNTAGVWTEELLKVGQQVIVIDPQNVWWGLKSSADGKQAGFPIVIFGGDHADVPITGTEGKQLADFVVENRVPCIFSLRHLSLSAQRRFVTALTEQIFFRKGEAKYQTPHTRHSSQNDRSECRQFAFPKHDQRDADGRGPDVSVAGRRAGRRHAISGGTELMKIYKALLVLNAGLVALNFYTCLTSWHALPFLGVCWGLGYLGLRLHASQRISLPARKHYNRNFEKRPATPLLWKE